MSEIKVNSIKGVGASAAAITVNNTDGTCSANITNNLSNRNKIINGGMVCSQRGTSFVSPTNTQATLDRFKINHSMGGAITVSQSTTNPGGFANSLKVDVTTADTIGAGEYLQINHKIEAQNLQDLAFGTSSAKNITFSFYVRSNLTGTYTISIQLPDNSNKQVSQTYTINSADTWERKSFTFTGDTSGVINNDNGNGMNIYWQLAIGSNYTGGSSSTTFQANSDPNFAAGHTANLLSSTSNEFYLTGVQLEVGDHATDFEHRSFAQELALCQRYYAVAGTIMQTGTPHRWVNTIHLPVEMRAKPTISNGAFDSGSGGAIASQWDSSSGNNSQRVFYQSGDHSSVSASYWKFDAEL